jgi:tRNA (guanine-N7-)-methyltransferase
VPHPADSHRPLDEPAPDPSTLDDPGLHDDDLASELRTFGRRRGRKLSPRQDALMRELLPRVAYAASNPVPDQTKPLWLEIGFGGGEHLIWQAQHNPAINLLGCEPFEDGVAKVLVAIEENNLHNITLHADDARDVLRTLPAASVARAFILFPDPWPKRRHIKRRLINVKLLNQLAEVLAPAAELRIGTDIPDYARTILMAFQQEPRFRWQAVRPDDWRIRPTDWPQTRYEDKAVREGRRSCYLSFKRTPD